MALNFTTQLELASGITVDNAYGRVAAVDQTAGTSVEAIVDIYISEAAYLAGKEPLQVSFDRTARTSYNRVSYRRYHCNYFFINSETNVGTFRIIGVT